MQKLFKNIQLGLWKLRHIHGFDRFAKGRMGLVICTTCHRSYYQTIN